jgi:hypothetical protein
MHAPAPERLTCLSCGYDLRAAAAGEKCPECGFAVADSVAGHARTAGRWAWKVRLGLLLLLSTMPLLMPCALTYSELASAGLPLTLLNFPGPKAWGGPLVRFGSDYIESGVLIAIGAGIIINTLGVWLVAAPGRTPGERPLSMRRWLRVYIMAAVPCVWSLMMPWFMSLPADDRYHAMIAVVLIELPATVMLYLYLGRVARNELRDPALAKRAARLAWLAAGLQALAAVALSGIIEIGAAMATVLLLPYAVAAIGGMLWAIDLLLDLYRALGDIERDASRR